jgi:hypothetical protein
MITLLCRVPGDRNRLGIIRVEAGGKTREFSVSAKSDPDLEIEDPQNGVYRLIKNIDVAADSSMLKAYGPNILVFQNDLIEDAPVIVLHGGDLDNDNKLFATHGGLRLSNSDLEALLEMTKNELNVRLVIREEKVQPIDKIFPHKVSENKSLRVDPEESGEGSTDPLAALAAMLFLPGVDEEGSVQASKEEAPVAEAEEKDFLGEGAQKQVGEISDEVLVPEETGDSTIPVEDSTEQQPAEEEDKDGQGGGAEPEPEQETEEKPEETEEKPEETEEKTEEVEETTEEVTEEPGGGSAEE